MKTLIAGTYLSWYILSYVSKNLDFIAVKGVGGLVSGSVAELHDYASV